MLEVVFNDEEVQRASYRCIGNNSIGATSDSVEIHLLGEGRGCILKTELLVLEVELCQPSHCFSFELLLNVLTRALKLFTERTNEVQVANTYSERRTEVEIFQYNGKYLTKV